MSKNIFYKQFRMLVDLVLIAFAILLIYDHFRFSQAIFNMTI